MGELLASFTFTQLLIVIGLILGALIFIVILLMKRGFSFNAKDKTFIIGPDGKQVEVDRQEVLNALLVVEALKIKDSIQEVDRIVFRYQKKYARDHLPEAQYLQLNQFKALVVKANQLEAEEEDVVMQRDYMYYSLLAEKMYNGIFADIMDCIEENGLASLKNPVNYAHSKAEMLLNEGLVVVNSMYIGVEKVSKQDHDKMLSSIRGEVVEVLSNIFRTAIQAATDGQKKKEEFRDQIIRKIGDMEGISEQQIRNLFSNVVAEDFLNH